MTLIDTEHMENSGWKHSDLEPPDKCAAASEYSRNTHEANVPNISSNHLPCGKMPACWIQGNSSLPVVCKLKPGSNFV